MLDRRQSTTFFTVWLNGKAYFPFGSTPFFFSSSGVAVVAAVVGDVGEVGGGGGDGEAGKEDKRNWGQVNMTVVLSFYNLERSRGKNRPRSQSSIVRIFARAPTIF